MGLAAQNIPTPLIIAVVIAAVLAVAAIGFGGLLWWIA